MKVTNLDNKKAKNYELNKLMRQKALEKCQEFERETGATVVYLSEFGSSLFGLDTEASDVDFRGVFVPSMQSVLLKTDKPQYKFSTGNDKSRNTNTDLDLQLHSVYEFFKLLSKGETGAVDVLFSMFREETQVLVDTSFVGTLKENHQRLLTNRLQSFVGYSQAQATRYGLKGTRYKELEKFLVLFQKSLFAKDMRMGSLFSKLRPAVEGYKYVTFTKAPGPRGTGNYDEVDYLEVLGKKFSGDVTVEYFLNKVVKMKENAGHRTVKASEGTDWKAMSHAVRVLLEVEELLDTGFVTFPLKDAAMVMEVKQGGTLTPDEQASLTERTLAFMSVSMEVVRDKMDNSTLPAEADKELMEQLLLELVMSTPV